MTQRNPLKAILKKKPICFKSRFENSKRFCLISGGRVFQSFGAQEKAWSPIDQKRVGVPLNYYYYNL